MKILLIAYYFPPDSNSGSFRPFFFANHLTELGDEITVLTCRQEDFLDEQTLDQEMLGRLDPRVGVVRSTVYRPRERLLKLRDRLRPRSRAISISAKTPRVKAENGGSWFQLIKDFITDLLATPDAHVGWIPPCIRQGLVTIRGQRPDIILSTGSPWSGLLAGSILKWLTGIPLVLDFRDPWITNPVFRRRHVFRRIDALLERCVIRHADLIISNTDELRHDFLARYSFIFPEQVVVITNGFEDYLPNSSLKSNNIMIVTHTGDLYSSRNPKSLLEATHNAIKHDRINPREFKLRFVGGIAVNDPIIGEILTSPFIASSIEVIPRVNYEESLRAMGESDVLILYQPGFPLQVPRKLYDYMAARRPILCIAESGSATSSLVERYELGKVCDNDAAQLEEMLVEFYGKWKNAQLAPLINDQCESFRNYNLVVQLRNHLEQVIKSHRHR